MPRVRALPLPRILAASLIFILLFSGLIGAHSSGDSEASAGFILPAAYAVSANAPDYINSVAYIVVDSALADSRDNVELEVVLVAVTGGLSSSRSVYCASSRKEDRVTIGANQEGVVTILISSSLPGVSRIAISLASQSAAERYLRDEIGDEEARIVQTDRGQDTFLVYFISGGLDIESCEMEFDKDTIAVMDNRYSDNAIGTISLRTYIDQPVANQQVTVYSRKNGILLYPTVSNPNNPQQGPSITLTTDKEGKASFVVRGYTLGDAEIICNVDGEEFSEFIYIDTAENVFDFEEPFWDEDDDEEEEEPVISRAHTKVTLSKSIGYEYYSNARYGLPTTIDSRDTILIGGVAMSEDEQPIREQHLVRACVTAGELDKSTTLTTSNGGAFSFSLTSRDICMGRYAVGLGTVEQLKGYLEGRVSADGCQLLSTGTFSFISREWDKYMICRIGEKKAVINGGVTELDVAPFIRDGRTMLTARPIAETIGAVPSWDQSKQTASFFVRSSNYTVTMQVGSSLINRTETYVAPKQYTSDVPAMILEGRTVLPLRALGEAFDMQTIYDEAQQMAAIYKLRPNPYDPRRDPNSPLYDPRLDPESDDYMFKSEASLSLGGSR
ncbi:MAG: copper amine oxidase N-terminal domain-containing protein [Clostridiales bacterium]|nr:copper amine oxidase N-terminal domain-containing protein [Clostridiales bacterium]